MPEALLGAPVYLYTRLGKCSGIFFFIDTTAISVWDNGVFQGIASLQRDGTLKDLNRMVLWVETAPRHQDVGKLLLMLVTSGNTDDQCAVPALTQTLFDELYADKGYISKASRESLHADRETWNLKSYLSQTQSY